jgi:hypothetical protein
MVVFPHANGHEIPAVTCVAAWSAFLCLHGHHRNDPLREPLPTRALMESLPSQLQRGQRFSLDVLCRCLVPAGYRDTAHATPDFLAANTRWIAPAEAWLNCRTGRRLQAARLTDDAVNAWLELRQQAQSAAIQEAWEKILACCP